MQKLAVILALGAISALAYKVTSGMSASKEVLKILKVGTYKGKSSGKDCTVKIYESINGVTIQVEDPNTKRFHGIFLSNYMPVEIKRTKSALILKRKKAGKYSYNSHIVNNYIVSISKYKNSLKFKAIFFNNSQKATARCQVPFRPDMRH